MKRRIRAGLIATIVWAIALVLVAAAATVCSSCGAEAADAAAKCTPAR
jgi:hypothetical protein